MIKVVLVEDEELLRREIALTTPWQELGCSLMGEAENGEEGLKLILKIRPHLIITDIRMPGMDGLTMLGEAEKFLGLEKPHAILLTGHSDFEYARSGIRLGVKDYLLKPIDDVKFHCLISKTAGELEKQIRQQRISEGMEAFDQSRLSLFKEYGPPPGGDAKDEYVRLSVEFIHHHFSQDISLDDTAREMGISQGYLSRIFKERTNYTFLEYLTCYRLRQALKLLRNRSLRINEIATQAGFQDSGYFIQLFRRYMGVTPGQFRKGTSGITNSS
ncbi:MAG: AraC family transcriptional regulator [Spirochaetaceae bacterium]|nr:AraC family transcriptional regulator [Spirochaetaceae bacterium]